VNKATEGYVVQWFNDSGVCIGQEFFAGDDVTFSPCDRPPEFLQSLYHMVQPKEGQ